MAVPRFEEPIVCGLGCTWVEVEWGLVLAIAGSISLALAALTLLATNVRPRPVAADA